MSLYAEEMKSMSYQCKKINVMRNIQMVLESQQNKLSIGEKRKRQKDLIKM